MNELKELVPDFELCNQIPLGEFEDSVFGWRYSPRIGLEPDWEVVPRAGNDVDCPVPTLAEIMSELTKMELCPQIHSIFTKNGKVIFSVSCGIGDFAQEENLATSALKLWLAFKQRSETENKK